jgi:hypothetical protein
MLSKIETFDDHLSNIEKTMRPIQETTASYTRAKDNVALTLQELEKTYEYYRVCSSVEEIINEGLDMSSEEDSRQYFDSMQRLSEAKTFFLANRHTMKSTDAVLASIDKLMSTASESCCAGLENLLVACGQLTDSKEGRDELIAIVSSEKGNGTYTIDLSIGALSYSKQKASFSNLLEIFILAKCLMGEYPFRVIFVSL